MRRLIICLIFLAIYGLGAPSAYAVPEDMRWLTLQNLKNRDGVAIGDKNVYGYFLGSGAGRVFIECNPLTGQPAGKAYYSTEEIESWTEDVIVDYEYVSKEDWSKVKRINPVQISVMAPNIIKGTGYDWEHYEETGELRRMASGPVQWPGSSGAYLVPGSDPDYWLIVAKLTNPNPWPVKASIRTDIDHWYRSWYSKFGIREIIEAGLGANETRFVLINRGKKEPLIMRDINSSGSQGITTINAWSEAYFNTTVTENLDPELPEYLRLNKGYIAYDNYGGPPVPRDLSGGFHVTYSVKCTRKDYRDTNWHFQGSVTWTENGWRVSPNEKETVNLDLAKQKVEGFFANRTVEEIPYITGSTSYNDRVYGDIYFYNINSTYDSASLSTGPYTNNWDVPGPVLVSYDYSNPDMNGNARSRILPVDEPVTVGWSSSLPVLVRKAMFIEFHRFRPSESADVGRLEKEIIPGYNVYTSTVNRPYFRVESTYGGYEVESFTTGSGSSRKYYWKVSISHNIKIKACNPDSSVEYRFSNVSLALPNVYHGANSFKSTLENRIKSNVTMTNPNHSSSNYNPTFISISSINVGPGQVETIYDADTVTEFIVLRDALSWDYDPYWDWYENYIVRISQNDILYAANSVLPGYFNWNGEAMFVGYSTQVQLIPLNSDVFTMVQMMGQYKDNRGNTRHTAIGLASGTRWFEPMSYFNPWGSTKGMNLRASDEVWADLWSKRTLQTSIRPTISGVKTEFWPYAYYSSNQWRVNLRY